METEPKQYQITRINNYIYFGSYEPPLMGDEEFIKLNFDVIINCTLEIKYSSKDKMKVISFPIIDQNVISFLENMDQVIDTIHNYLSKGKKIYIHCLTGTTTSPALIIYYLMKHKKFSYDKAYSLLKKRNPEIEIDSDIESSLRTIEDC